MWWNDATALQRAQAKQLVANGQLEFVIGGWTMPDEACPTYS
jgi:lysosomal alpha-mannosidase